MQLVFKAQSKQAAQESGNEGGCGNKNDHGEKSELLSSGARAAVAYPSVTEFPAAEFLARKLFFELGLVPGIKFFHAFMIPEVFLFSFALPIVGVSNIISKAFMILTI